MKKYIKFNFVLWITFFCFFVLIIFTSQKYGNQWYSYEKKTTHDSLSSISQLKSEQIENWLNERYADATVLKNDIPLSNNLHALITQSTNNEEIKLIRNRLHTVVEAYNYISARIIDLNGEVILSTTAIIPLSEHDKEIVTEVLSTGTVKITDPHFEYKNDQRVIRINLLIPISRHTENQHEIFGAIYITIDPKQLIYPLIQTWPYQSKSAESLLIKRELNEVVFLNDLRFYKNAALNLRFPIGEENLPAAMTLRGFEGVMSGTDYRGIEVLAAGQKIKGTDWAIIAKVDAIEIYGPLNEILRWINFIAYAFLLIGLTTTYFWQKSFRMRLLAKDLKSKLEKELLSSHYEYLSKYANDVILLTDNDWKIMEVNDKTMEVYQYSKDELIGMTVNQLEAKGGKTRYESFHSSRHDGFIFDDVHQRKDHTTLPVEISMRSIKVEGHRHRQLIIRDITERKKNERALFESEERWQFALEGNRDGVWDWDLLTNKVFFSKQSKAMLGYGEDEIDNDLDEWEKRIHPDDKEQVTADLDKHLDQVIPYYENEHRVLCKDGSYKWILDRGKVVTRTEDNKPLRMIGTHTDITERKRSEMKLHDSEERFRALYENAPAFIDAFDENGRCTLWNKQCQETFGWTMDEINSYDNTLALFYPDPVVRDEVIKSITVNPNGEFREWHPITKDGKTLTTMWSNFRLPDGSVFSLGYDITDRKQAEEKLNKTSRLYVTLSQINEAIVRERDKQKLFQKICDIGIEFGKFKFAWMGLIDQDKQFVTPVAYSGEGSDYLKDIKISLTDTVSSKGPTARSIIEGRSVVFNDLEKNPDYASWRERAIKNGYRSSGAFPIRIDGNIIGTLNVYAVDPHFFDEDEVSLLEEMTLDISFALDKLEEEKNSKQTKKTLELSEQRFKTIFEEAPLGVALIDSLTGHIYEVNPKFAEITGRTMEEITTIDWMSITHPDDVQEDLDNMALLNAGKIHGFNMQKRYMYPDGSFVWINMTIAPMTVTDKKHPRHLCMIEDITEYKKALQSEIALGQIIHKSSNEVYIFDSETLKFLDVNLGACMNLGYSIEELHELTPVDLKPEFTYETFNEKLSSLKSGDEEKLIFETIHKRKDGTTYPVEIYLQFLIYKDKQVFVANILDVTLRHQAEERSSLSEQRLRLHREQMPMGIVEWNTNFEFVDWNPEAEKIFGYRKEEVLGRNITETILPDSAKLEVDKVWSQLLSNSGGEHSINENNTKNGTIILCEWHNTTLVDENGTVVGITSTVEDITHKKEVEDQLHRFQKMESVGQLAGGIAHDFNNLLAIIQSNFEFLQDFNIKDDDYQKWINTGLKTVERGASLTRRLLSFSKAGTEQSKTVQINEFIDELRDLLSKSLTPKIKVELSLSDDVWYVNIDTDEFQDALVNLALNARDAMPEGGTLQIVTSNKELSEHELEFNTELEAGNYVVVSISDTGSGIDAATLERVFEPFFTTKESGKGTGLGLSMVYGFAKRSQGFVRFYSEVGLGTTVRLYLPMVDMREEEREEIEADKKELPGGTELILAVDDEQELLQGMKHRLESLGYQVLTASNGSEALEVINIHKGKIDLLLSDVVMPGGMSGYELAEETEKREAGIKILLASGFTKNITNGDKTENIHYKLLDKPYTKKELAHKLREVLGSV
jgi:PAS domain S-box-containing protein